MKEEPLNMKGFIGLVDADYLIYRYAAANEMENDLEEIINDISMRVDALEESIGCNAYLYFVSDKHNFRNEIGYTKKYKGTRKSSDKPAWFNEVSEYFMQEKDAIISVGMEADDALVMLHDADTVIITADKDLLQSPGEHVIMKTQQSPNTEFPLLLNRKFVTKEEGYRRIIKQTLLGDSVDNIPGCSGVGKKKVAELDEVPKEKLVSSAMFLFQKQYGLQRGLDMFNEMYALVRMRSYKDGYLSEKYKYLFDALELYRKYFKS